MKKLLALVLALVMTLSLCVVSSNAAFDGEEFDYNEAVQVLAKVGVFKGDENGKFNGKEELTREQAAKLVAYLDLGEKVAEALPSAKLFNDVETARWSAKYVAYCANAGYINGVGGGNFDPAGKLTGYAFGKMLLCALGYDAEYEELTGAAWSINVAKLMDDTDLASGVDTNPSAVLTREEAAQYCLNALKATVVEYSGGTKVTAGDVKVETDWYKYSKTGTGAYSYAIYGVSGATNTIELGEKLYSGDLKLVPGAKSDDFGAPASQWKYKTEIIDTFADTPDATYDNKVTKGTLYDLVSKDTVNKLSAAGTVVDGDTTYKLTVYVDGKEVATPTKTDYFGKSNTGAAGVSGNGTLTKVYIDDDNNVTLVFINTYVAQAEADYSSKNENLKVTYLTKPVFNATATPVVKASIATTLDGDDFAVADFKEDDYILYTVAYVGDGTTNQYEVQSIAAAEVVTGNVDSYSDEDSVTIDGTKYKYNKVADATSVATEYSTGDDASVVLDNNGYIVYVDEAVVDSDIWVYVDEVASASGLGKNYVADAYFIDGTNETINLKNYTDKTASPATTATDNLDTAVQAGWYTYTVTSEGKYKLTKTSDAVKGSKLTSGDAITSGKTALGGMGVKANASTVFVVMDKDDDITVSTGVANAPTVTVSGETYVYAVKNSSGFAKYVFVDAANASVVEGTTTVTDFVYLLKKDSTNFNADGDKYITYKALVNGEETTIDLAEDCSEDTLNVLYYNAKTNSDGYVTSMKTAVSKSTVFSDTFATNYGATPAVEVVYKDGVLTLPGLSDDLVLAEDYTIYLVSYNKTINVDAGATYEFNEVTGSGLESTLDGYTCTGSVYWETVDSDDNAVKTIYVCINA